MEEVEEIRHQTGMKEVYQKRKETIERVFADGKEKHGMRYTQYRGLAKVTMELTLLFACMNLKKLAIWKWRKGGLRKPCYFVWIFEPIYLYIKFKMVPGAMHPEPFCLQSEHSRNEPKGSFRLCFAYDNRKSLCVFCGQKSERMR